jgi:hypothetical protein
LSALEPRQERYLGRVLRSQLRVQIAGLLLALAGAGYVVFGVYHFHPARDPTAVHAFDRPIASAGQLLARYRTALRNLPPQTVQEQFLISELHSQTRITAAVAVLLLRMLVGTLILVGGLICLTVAVERHRLLALIATLRR